MSHHRPIGRWTSVAGVAIAIAAGIVLFVAIGIFRSGDETTARKGPIATSEPPASPMPVLVEKLPTSADALPASKLAVTEAKGYEQPPTPSPSAEDFVPPAPGLWRVTQPDGSVRWEPMRETLVPPEVVIDVTFVERLPDGTVVRLEELPETLVPPEIVVFDAPDLPMLPDLVPPEIRADELPPGMGSEIIDR